MTDVDLPDPGDGRSWQVEFDDGQLSIALVEYAPFEDDIEVQKAWIEKRTGNPGIPFALRTAAQKILEDDKLRALAGSYRYIDGKLVKE